ncbi:AAA family ATPase [Undibacterium squillarum]|uniref:AAA+ ATPase domain-containing protein n=1 Tax=Undibacterium squillarum TaxID=1131567 RepID=A0ABQ2XUS7_9BURK|nr:ATP-binding protein [Undibacterium squillarum]GGX34096.1 hypothetical protein GCM10010946_09050 [Undibacterium squillarum]
MTDWDDEIPQPIRERVKKSAASLEVAAQKVEEVRNRLNAIQAEAEVALNAVKEGMAPAIQQSKDAMFKKRLSEERWGSALKLTGLNTAFNGAQYAAYAYFLLFLYSFGIFTNLGLFPVYIYHLLTSFKGIVFFIAPYFLLVRQSRRLAARAALKASFAHLDQTLAKAEVQISGNATTGKATPDALALYPTADGNCVGYYPPFVNDLVPTMLNGPGAVHILLTASSEKSQQRLKLGYKHNAHELIVSGDASLNKYPEFNRLIAAKLESIRPVMNTLADGFIEFKSVKDAYAICKIQYEKDLELAKAWSQIALPDETSNKLIKLIELFTSESDVSPKGILLYGPPGTGKTSIANVLAKTGNLFFQKISESDLKGQYQGHTGPKVQAIFSELRKHQPAILFVDECEGVFKSRSSSNATGNVNFDTEMLKEFLVQWGGIASDSKTKILVIGATNLHENIDSAVMSRFTTRIEIGLPDKRCREKILRNEMKKAKLIVPDDLSKVIRDTTGFAGRDLETLVVSLAADLTGRNDPTEAEILKEIRLVRGKSSTDVLDQTWDDIVLPENIKNQFINLGKMLKSHEALKKSGIDVPSGALLWGPPGTGKTQLAKVLAGESGLGYIAASTAEIRKSNLGESGIAVKNLFERARSQSPCILFIDEIEILAPSRSGDQANSVSTEIIGQLLQEMDGIKSQNGMVFVLAATNHPALLDSAVASRLEPKLELPLPDLATRTAILKIILKNKPIDFDLEHGAHQIALLTEGKSGRDLNTLVKGAGSRATTRALTTGELIDEANPVVLQLADMTSQLDEAQEVVKVADLSWEDIVLPDSVKDQFVTLGKMLKNAEALRSSGIDAPRSALLYGPPGTGKTQLARVLASQSGLSFFAPTTAELRQKYIGHSGAAVRDMFEKARKMSPCILFIDEMEILAGQRTGSDNEATTEEIVGQFLQEMDGIKSQAGQVFVLGATNHPEFLDSAILSRFLQKIAIPLPELQARQAILKNLLRNKPVSADIDVIVLDLAAQTEGYSGRDLRNLVDGAANSATTRAMKSSEAIDPVNNPIRITKEDLMQALSARQVTQLV